VVALTQVHGLKDVKSMGIKGNDFSDMIDEVFEKEGLPGPQEA
jgi:hypothetical protein